MATLGTLYNAVGTNQSFLFRDSTDYAPSANSVITEGTPTAVQIDCTSLADDAARQSDKCDLGANRAPGYFCRAAIEFAATPTRPAPCTARRSRGPGWRSYKAGRST